MNNNSIAIDRYLQNEMSAAERTAFENTLAADTSLQEELRMQQQIIQAATTAGIKMAFKKAIRGRLLIKQATIWGAVILISAAIILVASKNNFFQHSKSSEKQPAASEQFLINAAADTIIETKDGVVFAIPANAFNTSSSTVQLEIKTAVNAYDILNNGLATTSNGALLQTAGMFYINGVADGKSLTLTKDINVSVPAANINPNMQLFDGVEDKNGRINWVNPKPIDKSLRTYDITTLDFYPPKYIPTLKALGKNYQYKNYTDSLYYSFSGYPHNTPKADAVNEVVTDVNYARFADFKDDGDQQMTDSLQKDYSDTAYTVPYQIDPAYIKAIWDRKFNNTFLATKEFEERLHFMHSLCSADFLKIYLSNLNKPLYISDQLCAKTYDKQLYTKHIRGADGNDFITFAKRKDGGVMLPNGMQQKLSLYFQQKYKAYKEAIAKTYTKYQHTLDSLNHIADYKRREQALQDFTRADKNFKEELCSNLTDAYRQIGKEHNCNENILPPSAQYYNVTINTTGWKNLDAYVIDATASRQSMHYTDTSTGKTATIVYNPINISIENIDQFDRVLIYVIPDSLSSFQRLEKEGNIFKEQLNARFKYDAIMLAYKGTQPYFFSEKNVSPKDYVFTLAPVSNDALHNSVSIYSINKTEALTTEFDYQLFEQQEVARNVQLQNDTEFREKIAHAIFNCLGPAIAAPPVQEGSKK